MLLVLTTGGALLIGVTNLSFGDFIKVYAAVYDRAWFATQKEAFNIF